MFRRMAALLSAVLLLAGLTAPAAQAEQLKQEQGELGLGQVTDRFMEVCRSSAEFSYGPSLELITHPLKGVDNDTANDNLIRYINMHMEGVNAAAYFRFGDGTDAPGQFLTLELEPSGIPTENAPNDLYFDYWRPVKFYFAEADWCQHSGKYPDDFITSGEPYQALVQRAAQITQKYYSVRFCYDNYSGALLGEHHPEDPLQGGSISDYVEQQTGQPLPPEVAEYYGNQQMGQDGFEAYLRTVTLADGRHLTEEEIQEILNRQTGGQNDGQIHYNHPMDDPDNHRYDFSQETTTFAGFEATVTTGTDWFNGQVRKGVHYTILVDELLPGVQLLADIRWDGPKLGCTYYMDEAEQQKFRSRLDDDLAKLEQYLHQIHYLYDVREGRDEAGAPAGDVLEPGDTIEPESTYVDASDDPTSEQKISVPAVIGGAVAAGAVLVGGRLVLKKKKPEKKKKGDPGAEAVPGRSRARKPEPEREQEEEKPKSTYQLRVQKEFGDTLAPGEVLTIFARMVEITPDGTEHPAPDLSRRIRISSPGYLLIDQETMAGEFKAARLTVPQGEEYPPEAVVVFDFAGVYKVHMRFKVRKMEVIFAQENLTLPAFYSETEHLPFIVTGIEQGKDPVQVEVLPAGGYKADLEWNREDQLYYAHITETSREEGEAGTCDGYVLHVTATHAERTIEGDLPLYRFHLGLNVAMDSGLNCFLELREESRLLRTEEEQRQDRRLSDLQKSRSKDFQIAQNKGRIDLFDWDPETHKILHLAPVPDSYELTALDDRNSETLKALNLKMYLKDELVNGGMAFSMMCTGGILAAPNRFRAKLQIKVSHKGKDYLWEDELTMRSMPVRQYRDTAHSIEVLKQDRYTSRKMEELKEYIISEGLVEQLFVLVKLIDVQQNGYHKSYGYDPYTVHRIFEAYQNFCSGKSLGANATPIPAPTFVDTVLAMPKEMETSWYYIGGRITLAVVTKGTSEMFFKPLDAYYLKEHVTTAMETAVDKGGGAWDAFCAGTVEATSAFLTEKAMQAAVKVGTGALKVAAAGGKAAVGQCKAFAKKTTDAAKNLYKSIVKNADNSAPYLSAADGKAVTRAAKAGAESQAAARQAVERKLKLWRSKNPVYSEAELAEREMLKVCDLNAFDNVEHYRSAEWLVRHCDTEANRKLFANRTIFVQKNKISMNLMNRLDGVEGQISRKNFNRFFHAAGGVYDQADDLFARDAAAELSEQLGREIRPSDIHAFKGATGNSKEALLRGDKVTFDRDVTYYVTIDGKEIPLEQAMAERIYEKAFYKAALKHDAPTPQIAKRFTTDQMDQTVVQTEASPEHYGEGNLEPMLTDHAAPLRNPERVAQVVEEKGKHWLKLGETADKQDLLKPGYTIEGNRQIIKQFNLLDKRDLCAMSNPARSDGITKINGTVREEIEACKLLFEQGELGTDLVENRRFLLDWYGVDYNAVAENVGHLAIDIG